MTVETSPDEPRQAVFKAKDAMSCALDSKGSKLAIIAKTKEHYDSEPIAGYIYDLTNLENVEDPFQLKEGSFGHAQRVLFTSNDKFLLVSFAREAFGSSPSICAYDSEFAIPIAWFVSPLHNNFTRMAVPCEPCSKFVVNDETGKLFVFQIEES